MFKTHGNEQNFINAFQIDRFLPVADRESIAEFGLLFSEKASKDFNDSHLWFSIVGRPAISRFTRLQRVSIKDLLCKNVNPGLGACVIISCL